MYTLNETSVLVLGLGSSGLAMARWCAKAGARVTVVDTRANPPGLEMLKAQWPQVQFKQVLHFTSDLLGDTQARLICRSPGLTPHQIAPLVSEARQSGLPVWGEIELFQQGLKSLEAEDAYQPQILAITGTNGKTTVTSLTGQLVERSGKKVQIAGNIGPTLLDTLSDCMDQDQLPQVWVLELSSFQLDGLTDFTPTMGTVLNLTQDHLDWHGSMAAYASAKACIFGPHCPDAPPMLLNRDDPLVLSFRPPQVKGKEQRRDISFGSDSPARPGDYGLETVNGITWLVRAIEQNETGKRRKSDEEDIYIQRLMPADALRIRGRHNALNALAALALAQAAGCPLSQSLYGLREYRGEPHRVESVGVLNDIEYFDDSKGTNVGATAAALRGLGEHCKLVVILGGEGKGQDFAPLIAPLSQFARAVVLIGRDASMIEASVSQSGVLIQRAGSMEEAVALATQMAQANEAVLLSPACASFDMFHDYVHRAQVFVQAVRQLAQAQGHSLLERL